MDMRSLGRTLSWIIKDTEADPSYWDFDTCYALIKYWRTDKKACAERRRLQRAEYHKKRKLWVSIYFININMYPCFL